MSLLDIEPKIKEYHDEITEFITEIDKKMIDMVQGHEKDFLVAFRSIMSQVNTEMTKLREISDEEALLIKRNTAINDLKSALEWFQSEAVKLSEACSDIQEKYDIHKQKIHALETENQHLEKMVRVYTEENESLKTQIFSINDKNTESVQEMLETNLNFIESDNLEEIFGFFQVNDPEITQPIIDYVAEKQSSAIKALDHKLFIKEKQQKKFESLVAAKEKFSVFEGEFEDLFNDCVQKVMNEAYKRRSKQVALTKWPNDLDKFNLTAADKRKVLEEFITHPQVYALLSQKLFPDYV